MYGSDGCQITTEAASAIISEIKDIIAATPDGILVSDEEKSPELKSFVADNRHISYQRHQHRTEVWTFTECIGKLILDGEVKKVRRGDVAVIKAGTKHAIQAVDVELYIIEVQIGDELTEDDIERLDWDWVN